MDYSVLSQEILKYLRGAKSQQKLSQGLGFSFNQVGKWESGATVINWLDFLHLCQRLNIPIEKHINEMFFWSSPSRPEFIVALIKQHFGFSNTAEMARKISRSRSVVSRWLSNSTSPDFPDILRLLDYHPFVLSTWLSRFIELENLACFRERFNHENSFLKSLQTNPYVTIVHAALQLSSYQRLHEHSDAWIAEKTKLPEKVIAQIITQLHHGRLISLRKGLYHPLLANFTFVRVPAFRKLIHVMNEETVKRFSQKKDSPSGSSLSSCRIFAVSDKAAAELNTLLVTFHHEVGELLKRDQDSKNQVRCLLMHHYDLET